MDTLFIRRQIPSEEFDYQMLLDSLAQYARPRDKITDLLGKGVILRVKKGLYVFGAPYRNSPVSREVLANLIYGPSYISLDYALQYHHLIPERVEELTSVTCGRSRRFSTPLGVFSYRRISMRAFQVGMDRVSLEDGRSFLIATPEKALADKLSAERGAGLRSRSDLRQFLLENLRVDPANLTELDPAALAAIAGRLRSRRTRLLADLIARMRRGEKEA